MSDALLQVLLISPKPPPRGGIGTWTEIILAEAAHRKDIVIHHVDISPHWREIHQLGYLRRLIGGTIQGFYEVARILVILKTKPVSAIHITSSGSLALLRDSVILWIAKQFRIPAFLHMHFGYPPVEVIRNNKWEWKLMRLALQNARGAVVLDEPSEKALKAALPHIQVAKIPNSISFKKSITVPNASVRDIQEILFVGWLTARKCVRELVETWSAIISVPSRLVLIGPGDAKMIRELRQIANLCGVGERLEITGEMPYAQAIERMQQTDIFVLPSCAEGFPYVILEAMICGKPIVATAVGAVPEMLDQHTATPCGVVVPPSEIEPLRAALELLLGDRVLRHELGRRARAKVEREYATPIVFEKLMRLWRGE